MVSATVTASLSDIDHDGRWSTYDENVRKLSRVSFGSHKSTPVKHTVNICYPPPPPRLQLPTYN
jgi:hypothetical protein